MKTIKEAAREYAITKSSSEVFQNQHVLDFKAGSAEAQRWIPIEEELPEFTSAYFHNAVNVRFAINTGEVRETTATLEAVPRHNFNPSPVDSRWFIYPSSGHELKAVTHFRPIERQ
ncbi:MAG TPA: hypothetical protein VIK55_06440 [Paludibacter sp.]